MSDLGVQDLEVALQVGDVPLDGVAVAAEQLEPVSDGGAAFATELGESLR